MINQTAVRLPDDAERGQFLERKHKKSLVKTSGLSQKLEDNIKYSKK